MNVHSILSEESGQPLSQDNHLHLHDSISLSISWLSWPAMFLGPPGTTAHLGPTHILHPKHFENNKFTVLSISLQETWTTSLGIQLGGEDPPLEIFFCTRGCSAHHLYLFFSFFAPVVNCCSGLKALQDSPSPHLIFHQFCLDGFWLTFASRWLGKVPLFGFLASHLLTIANGHGPHACWLKSTKATLTSKR